MVNELCVSLEGRHLYVDVPAISSMQILKTVLLLSL
jgi:hypothetical protein